MEERLRPLIEKGKASGCLGFDEVSAVLPDLTDPDELAAVVDLLEQHGIALVDDAEVASWNDPPPAASFDPAIDRHDPELLALVRGWGVPATDAIALREPGGRLFEGAVIVPGADALRAWVTLRGRVPEFPHWPVIGRHRDTPTFGGGDGTPAEADDFDPDEARLPAAELIAEADRRTPEPWLFRHASRAGDPPPAVALAVYDPPRPRPTNPRPEELDWVLAQQLIALEHPIAGTAYPFVRIDLAPTPVPWQVFAYWPFGGCNDAPWPAEQLAMVRHWHERFGAEPISSSGDYFEMVVWDPPTSRAAARRLAAEHMWFGEETIFAYGNIPDDELITRAVSRRLWYFWWD